MLFFSFVSLLFLLLLLLLPMNMDCYKRFVLMLLLLMIAHLLWQPRRIEATWTENLSLHNFAPFQYAGRNKQPKRGEQSSNCLIQIGSLLGATCNRFPDKRHLERGGAGVSIIMMRQIWSGMLNVRAAKYLYRRISQDERRITRC